MEMDRKLWSRVAGIVGQYLDFREFGIDAKAKTQNRWRYVADACPLGVLGFAIKSVAVEVSVYENEKKEQSAEVHVRYQHSDLVGSGGNGVSFYLHRKSVLGGTEWLTSQENELLSYRHGGAE